jgi:hypothetical protein
MIRICYMVIATLPDTATAEEYVTWLEDGHVDAVISHGAHSAMIVRLEPAATRPRVMTQYIFTTRELFDRYVSTFAPALRADGLKRFPPERGITFERLVGEIV